MKPASCREANLYRYQSADGSCNNLRNPQVGKAGLPHVRYLPPEYGDGRDSLRSAAGGRTLPSSRMVSNIVAENEIVIVPRQTALNMHFGQLLDHDIGHTPVESERCSCETTQNCIPIAVPLDDPSFHTRCIPLTRSKTVPAPGCVDEPREQVNQLTAFIDGSLLYGSSAEVVQELRAGRGGLLRVSPNPFNASLFPYLPEDEGHVKCSKATTEFPCGLAGDKRAAVQPGLTALHTVFVRYHNKVAADLSAMNWHWGEDRLFRETRKIISSILQHITYNEYLPVTLGFDLMERHRLATYGGYQEQLDPTMPNVFAHAAFRMGHSQVSTNLTRVDVRYQETYDPVILRFSFFNGSALYDAMNGGLDSLIRGMIVQPLDKIDRFFSDDVTRFLFANPLESFGLDLVAINTQRGRDHGIPGYTKWRQFCGLPNVTAFADFKDVMKQDTINVLQKAYEHVDDVDAFIGMVVEEPLSGALVGPTVGCILGKHFHNLKHGDRFWYENTVGVQAFNTEQIHAIKAMTLARMFCDTLDEIESIQPFVFHMAGDQTSGISSFADYSARHSYPSADGALPGFNNTRRLCSDDTNIPHLDLRPWLDRNTINKCKTKSGQKSSTINQSIN